jgi:hypothetical protein
MPMLVPTRTFENYALICFFFKKKKKCYIYFDLLSYFDCIFFDVAVKINIESKI